ncbi:NADH dehydrogenase [ubiquinone] 1 beta subcomplex subunit 9 [Acipenser ruthenus]|uniref:NADH dehydrogenase [ubiquinone] 1 beta subcomplex subunit 9 n=1 Tax=Acipenser ruthenus TaxID=7906 RepID=A0A444V6U0_ACIRT|nr:NADH dehydrogenase [ubiquinone] 1 beta subcomplex subunit 9 [Acipenser ruthenus]
MASGFLTHQQKVLRLYKKALRHLESWCIFRDKYRFYACMLRARFDENKDEKDMVKATMMLKSGEEEFWANQHPQPYIFPDSPGGTSYERYECFKVPDWCLDYWHPTEKAMYPDYFAKREQWKKLRDQSWDREGYLTAPLAPAPSSSYKTAWNSYSRFCAQHRSFPAQFNHKGIMAFIVHLRDILQLSPTTIKSYLSGIQHHYRLKCIPAPTLLSLPAVSMTLRGIEKSLPPTSPIRMPITTVILLKVKQLQVETPVDGLKTEALPPARKEGDLPPLWWQYVTRPRERPM